MYDVGLVLSHGCLTFLSEVKVGTSRPPIDLTIAGLNWIFVVVSINPMMVLELQE